jgi:outer membrane protein OmpA-like peptidoglycan-associated protein
VVVPALFFPALNLTGLDAQECLGFHGARSTIASELTAQQQPGVGGLGLGISRAAVFGLVETATDPVTGSDLFSLKRSSLTLGVQRQQQQDERASICAGVSARRDQYEESPSVKSTGLGGMVALGYRVVDGESPVILFGQAQLESRRDELVGAGVPLGSERSVGSGLRIGAAYRYQGWLGARTFVDVRSSRSVVGASLSLTIPRREALDADGDGVPDRRDNCPNTPAGARVNADGCEPDADGDGVPDSRDNCPNTPTGARVNADGCEPDTDGDGVPDSRDNCPNTPAGARVNADGCEPDADGDGVPDSRDNCPNTPAGARVNADGCEPDADGDGVPDSRDNCPNTPAGVAVDANGCELSTITDGSIVNFATAQATLTPAARRRLDELAAALTSSPTVRLEIGGHTDSTGPAALNTRLGIDRANAVRNYLIAQGVDASRLTVRGFASSSPAASNNTPAGRAANRRATITRLD